LRNIIFFDMFADMVVMNGVTLTEIAAALGIQKKAVEKRLQTAGIKPLTREAIYPPDTIERIKDIRMGRPSKKLETGDNSDK
jgi:predicted ArsR family transcriptional regulator